MNLRIAFLVIMGLLAGFVAGSYAILEVPFVAVCLACVSGGYFVVAMQEEYKRVKASFSGKPISTKVAENETSI